MRVGMTGSAGKAISLRGREREREVRSGSVLRVRKTGDGAEEAWELWTWTLATGVSRTELHPSRTQHQGSRSHLGFRSFYFQNNRHGAKPHGSWALFLQVQEANVWATCSETSSGETTLPTGKLPWEALLLAQQ